MLKTISGDGNSVNRALLFSAAIGICIAVTALPVLAALLKEMKIVDSDLGQQALAFAAMTDGALWISVSALLIVSVGAQGDGLWHLALVPIYLVAATIILPRLMRQATKVPGRHGESDDTVLVVACTLAFSSAFVSEFTGLGYVIGAFLAGVAMPTDLRAALIQRLDWSVTLLLMPFFFMVTGLRTEADLLSFPVLSIAAAATVVAILGKIGGVMLPAILLGRNGRRALALGVLLQSKGLMEVLVVTVLIDAGVVTPIVFSALILVAVLCTILAMPLTRLIVGTDSTRWPAVAIPRDRALVAMKGEAARHRAVRHVGALDLGGDEFDEIIFFGVQEIGALETQHVEIALLASHARDFSSTVTGTAPATGGRIIRA